MRRKIVLGLLAGLLGVVAVEVLLSRVRSEVAAAIQSDRAARIAERQAREERAREEFRLASERYMRDAASTGADE